MENCNHIIGMATMLNPNEGSAYINRYVRQGRRPEQMDRRAMFKHCPLCGAEIQHLPSIKAYELVNDNELEWESEWEEKE